MQVKNIFKILSIAFFTVMCSCSNELEEKITKRWSVSKMEKMVPVTLSNHTPINVGIHSKMSYNFLPKNKVKLITQIGSSISGSWSVKDSVISVNVKKEKKNFKIIKLTEKELILKSGKFKFYLNN